MSITHPTTKITRRWKLKSSTADTARTGNGARANRTERPTASDPRWVFDKSANPGDDALGWPLVRASS